MTELRSEFGRSLVNSTLSLAIAVGQSVIDTSQNALANLGWDRVVLSRPVFAGDTLWSESLVLGKRESVTRPEAGIVKIKTRTLNQHGVEVLSFLRTFYVYKRAADTPQPPFPESEKPLELLDEESSL